MKDKTEKPSLYIGRCLNCMKNGMMLEYGLCVACITLKYKGK